MIKHIGTDRESLSRALAKYQDLVDNLSVGVYRNTPGPKGHFLEANPAMISIFEAKSKKEFMKCSVSDLYQNPKERKDFVAEITLKGEVKNREANLITLKGRKFTAAITAVMRKDEKGNTYFDGIVEDITERKKMERELAEYRDKLEIQVEERTQQFEKTKKALLNVMFDLREVGARNEAILASIASGVIVVNKNGIIVLMNLSAEKLLGWTVRESIGKKWFQILKREDEFGNVISPEEGALKAALIGNVTTLASISGSFFYARKDGSKFPVVRTVSPIFLEGKVIGAVDVFRDATRDKEVDKMKSEFMDIAAHDLRTPAAAIRGFISRVLEGDAGGISDKAKELLSGAYEGDMRLIDLIDDFLIVSRFERGKIQIIPKSCDLTKIIETSIGELSDLASAKNLTLEYKKIKLPPTLADEERVIQVLNNLIGNAVKFTEKGGITVWHEIKNGQVVTNITDTGIGISPDSQKQLFQKYYKGDESINRSGLGLGLYISRQCIEGLGGEIWAKSEKGKGSTFSFSLPFAKSVPTKI